MIQYYDSLTDDFVESKNQAKKVPENYRFIKTSLLYNAAGAFLFQILKLIGFFYAKFALHLKIEGKEKIKNYLNSPVDHHFDPQKSAKIGISNLASSPKGYYIYANHTLKLGDVFNPALYNPVHPYYVCSSSNLGIPILGPILPIVGALPIPDSISGKKQLFRAISTRAKQGKAIVFYPEAHLWPYYTKIRPFEKSAFSFPIRDNLPIFTATTVFTEHPHRKKPNVAIYIDGPFYPDKDLDKKARVKKLHDEAFTKMTERTKLSDYEYIKYQKRQA